MDSSRIDPRFSSENGNFIGDRGDYQRLNRKSANLPIPFLFPSLRNRALIKFPKKKNLPFTRTLLISHSNAKMFRAETEYFLPITAASTSSKKIFFARRKPNERKWTATRLLLPFPVRNRAAARHRGEHVRSAGKRETRAPTFALPPPRGWQKAFPIIPRDILAKLS